MESVLTEYKETQNSIRDWRHEVVLLTTILMTGSFAGLNFVAQSGLLWNLPFLVGLFFFFVGWLLGLYIKIEVYSLRRQILLRNIDGQIRIRNLLSLLDESNRRAELSWDRVATPLIYTELGVGATMSVLALMANLPSQGTIIPTAAFFLACSITNGALYIRSSKERKSLQLELNRRLEQVQRRAKRP